MNKLTAQLGTILKVFVGTLLALMITNGANILEMSSWNDWKPYLAAGISAVIVWGYNFLNPTDARYGYGAE
jgi:hypothetical protein